MGIDVVTDAEGRGGITLLFGGVRGPDGRGNGKGIAPSGTRSIGNGEVTIEGSSAIGGKDVRTGCVD